MKIKLQVFGYLRKYLKTEHEDSVLAVVSSENEKVSDLLNRFGLSEEVEKIVLINGLHEGPQYVLRDGDQVSVIPEIAGG